MTRCLMYAARYSAACAAQPAWAHWERTHWTHGVAGELGKQLLQ